MVLATMDGQRGLHPIIVPGHFSYLGLINLVKVNNCLISLIYETITLVIFVSVYMCFGWKSTLADGVRLTNWSAQKERVRDQINMFVTRGSSTCKVHG